MPALQLFSRPLIILYMAPRLLLLFALVSTAFAGIIDDVRSATAGNNFSAAQNAVRNYRAQRGDTPELIEAVSWMARGALASGQLDQAASYAKEAERLARRQLKTRALDAEPHLPVALGAALEVQSQVFAARGQRAQAISLLQSALATYRRTSIRARLQKNLNLLSLAGKPAPALQSAQYLGPPPLPLAQLKGKPVLLFFWAHWCGDCKFESPIIARLKSEYAGKGLVVMGPTQRYGYAARGEDATPAQELAYIDQVRQRFYSGLLDMPVPVSEENFNAYGASTTPTLVLVDRAGRVALYHPGAMQYDELKAAIEKILG
jgi:thiol-disulfide isomerase/thioredoxin